MVNSVLLKNINSLRSSLKENISYIDLNYKGIDENGSVTVNDEKAVGDRFRIWLQSGSNDYHRNPNFGGFLEKNVVKRPFSEENCKAIEAELKAEANERFPEIKIVDVSVTCDYSRRRWGVKVSVMDSKTGLLDESMMEKGGSTIVYSVNQ